MGLLKEFRTFIERGNVIDLAVGIIIGAAFTKIVGSLVADILMPLLGILTSQVNFATLKYELRNPLEPDKALVTLTYGNFLQATIDFLIVAFCVFLLVKGINALKRKEEEAPKPPPPEEVLLTEIRDLLKARQPPTELRS